MKAVFVDRGRRRYVLNDARKAMVREAADTLDDLLECDEADLVDALNLDSWPTIPKRKLLDGWRRLMET